MQVGPDQYGSGHHKWPHEAWASWNAEKLNQVQSVAKRLGWFTEDRKRVQIVHQLLQADSQFT